MKLILNIFDHGVVMHVKFHQGGISFKGVIAFDCQNFNDFTIVNHNVITNGWNFKKLILNIYVYSVAMHLNFL